MATSLKIARRNGHNTFIKWGEAAKRHLQSQGIAKPSEAKIYLDRDGFVSYKGKAVRRRDGTFVPYANAPLTEQGKATAARKATAANQAALELVGKSRTVTSRKQLEREAAQRAEVKAAQRAERKKQEAKREQERREAAERKRAAERQASAVSARKIADPKPTLQPVASTPRPAPAPARRTPSGLVRAQAVAFDYQGYTVIVLKPD